MIVTFPSNSFKEYQYVWITFSVHNFLCTNQWIHSTSSKAIEHVAWQVFWLVSVNKRLPNRLRSLSVAWGSVHHAFMKHTATGLFRILTWFPFNHLSLTKDKQTNTLQIYCLSLEKQLILLVFVKGGIEILPYLCDII